jgi:signal transduction histidine kinase
MRQDLRKITLFIIVFTTIQVSDGLAQFDLGFPLIKNYKATDYKAQPQVWSGTQDSAGILYFGNNDGVMIFTGSKWEIVPLSNHSIVRSLKVFNDKIAIGGSDEFGFLSRSNGGTFKYKSLTHKLPDTLNNFNDIHSIEQLGDTLYFGAEHYIFKYYSNKISIIESKTPLQLGLFSFGQNIFAYLPGKGIGIVKTNKIEPINNTEILKGLGAVKILNTNTGNLLVTTVGGIFQLSEKKGMQNLKNISLPCSGFLQTSYIFDVCKINNQYYAFASLKNGILITDLRLNPLSIINRDAGLADDVCTRVFPDYSGNLWGITQNGISFIELQSPISAIDERVGINTALSASLLLDSIFYYGSNFKLSYVNLNQKKSGIPNKFKPVGGYHSQVWKIDTIAEHILIAQRNGLHELINGKRNVLYDKSGNIWNFVRHPFHTNKLIVGGDALHVFKINKKEIRYAHPIPSKLREFRWFVFDKHGKMWISNIESGIYQISLNNALTQIKETKKYDVSKGLPANELNYIWKIDNKIVSATAKGIYLYDTANDLFKPWKPVNDLIQNQVVWVIKPDKNGGFYYGGNEGIGRIIKNTDGSYTLEKSPYNRFDAHILHTLSPQNDSLITFGFSENALILNRNKIVKTQQIKSPIISAVKTTLYDSHSDSALIKSFSSKAQKIEIPHGALITFKFDLPFFTSPDKNLFKTYMDGYDDHWSEWSSATEKEYTNLPHGQYTFRVKAINVFETESNEAVIHFTIIPPWYHTWWAYLLFTGLFGAIISLSILLYTYRLRRYNAHLEKIVAERTKEIRDKNIKLAALTEFRKNVSHMIVHDLKNPLNVILGLSEKPFVKEAGQIMLNLVNNILDVQKFEDASMQLNTSENQLGKTVKNAISMVHLPAQAKEITIINRVSAQIKANYDAGLIERVFVNLFTNAIKYTPVGGEIIVETSIKNNLLNVHVQDNGKGIDEKMINKIFERYTQIDPEKLGVTFSTGLGLNYCKLAVEAHKGTIKATSKPGEGATFTFTIPQYEIDNGIEEDIDNNESNKILLLSSDDQRKILDIAPDLFQLDVYQRTQLENINLKIVKLKNENIKRWSKKLQKAIYDCDEKVYKSLINMLKDE